MMTTIVPSESTAFAVGSPRPSTTWATSLKGCLIVSQVSQHLRELNHVAQETGWQPFVCEDVTSALKTMCKNSVQLAVIDFQQAAADEESLQNLAEYIKWLGGVLLIVNAEPDDEATERWARQLGVWTYLPGILTETDLSGLLAQAREVVEKLGAGPRYTR